MTKTCFRCERTLPVEEFYRHPKMKDGRLGKCKDCARRDVTTNRANKREQYTAYEKGRGARPERRAAKLGYSAKHNRLHPEKRAARLAVSNALRDGRLTRKPCEVCQNPKTEAHHPDYSQPLSVRWLCHQHHRETEGRVAA